MTTDQKSTPTTALEPTLQRALEQFMAGQFQLASVLERLSGPAAKAPDSRQVRAGRDFDVIRGLLGQPSGPAALLMTRQDGQLVIEGALPPGSRSVTVEALSSPRQVEHIALDEYKHSGRAGIKLPLGSFAGRLVDRVEVTDGPDGTGTVLAFGPRLASDPTTAQTPAPRKASQGGSDVS